MGELQSVMKGEMEVTPSEDPRMSHSTASHLERFLTNTWLQLDFSLSDKMAD